MMKSMPEESLTYKKSGVDTKKGQHFVKAINFAISQTKRDGCIGKIGGFGGIFDLKQAKYKDPILVAANDGVGTKVTLAQQTRIHSTIGIDLVAMCVNDLITQKAEPLFFLDYFASGHLDTEIAQTVVESIAKGCQMANCGLIGGETAEMPGMYKPGEYDLAGFAVGALEREQFQETGKTRIGDYILGLGSNGVHSNGFSLLRHLLKEKNHAFILENEAPFNPSLSLAEALMAPTRIYVSSLLSLFSKVPIQACAHITGGGFYENLPRVMEKGQKAVLDFSPLGGLPPLFQWIKEEGNIASREIYSVFNAGIGMVLFLSEDSVSVATRLLEEAGESVFCLGKIEPHQGDAIVLIKSIDEI